MFLWKVSNKNPMFPVLITEETKCLFIDIYKDTQIST